MIHRIFIPILIFFLMISCGTSPENNDQQLIFTFQNGLENWEGGFADYPFGEEDFYNLQVNHAQLPEPLDSQSGSLNIRGDNRSDDLFMFIKRKVTGLEANATYALQMNIEIASNAPANSIGAGGSPGSSVYLKAGATTAEPLPLLKNEAGYENGFYRMNIDIGNQSQEGSDMKVIGNIGHDGEDFVYQIIERFLENNFTVQTNSNGELWIIIGTDSGFEGTTSLYYNRIEVTLSK